MDYIEYFSEDMLDRICFLKLLIRQYWRINNLRKIYGAWVKRWSLISIIQVVIFLEACGGAYSVPDGKVDVPVADVIDWLEWKIYHELDGAIASQDQLVIERLQRQISRIAIENKKTLIDSLASKEDHKRAVCAAAIGFTQDKTLVPHLIKMLDDESPEVQKNALASLGFLNDPKASIDAVKKLSRATDKKVKSAALYSLYHLLMDANDEELMQQIVANLSDPSDEVRVHSILILAKVKYAKAVPKVIESLRDNTVLVRINSAIALGQINDRSAILPLINLLADEEINVKKSAYIALGQITKANLPMDYKEWKKWHESQQ